jgi:hypothetical protein
MAVLSASTGVHLRFPSFPGDNGTAAGDWYNSQPFWPAAKV